jgi:hypothetical protein
MNRHERRAAEARFADKLAKIVNTFCEQQGIARRCDGRVHALKFRALTP